MSIVSALPIADDNNNAARISSNQLFHQLNDILKREITKEVDESVEVGDKIKSDDGSFQINIQKFSTFQSFPLSFNKQDTGVLEDKNITSLVSDFDGDSEYKIEKNSSEESSEEDSSESDKNKPAGKLGETTVKKSSDNQSTTTTSAAKSSTTTTSTEKPQSAKSTTTESDKSTTTTTTEGAKALTTTDKPKSADTSSSPATTTIKNEKLLQDIAEQPAIFSHI